MGRPPYPGPCPCEFGALTTVYRSLLDDEDPDPCPCGSGGVARVYRFLLDDEEGD